MADSPNRGRRSFVPKHAQGHQTKRGGFFRTPAGFVRWYSASQRILRGSRSLSD